jgi:hypothetical protein
MKSLIARAILIALLTGPIVTFLNTVIWSHVNHRYEPPLTQDEMKQWEKLPAAEMEMKLQQRRVPISKLGWLSVSIRYGYFWKRLAATSIIPTIGVFLACLYLSRSPQRGMRGNSVHESSS